MATRSYPEDEGLQVVLPHEQTSDNPPEVYYGEPNHGYHEDKIADYETKEAYDSSPPVQRRRVICGLILPVFWLVVAFVIVLIIGVGVGVGVGVGAHNHSTSSRFVIRFL
jgi:hypothetical protein